MFGLGGHIGKLPRWSGKMTFLWGEGCSGFCGSPGRVQFGLECHEENFANDQPSLGSKMYQRQRRCSLGTKELASLYVTLTFLVMRLPRCQAATIATPALQRGRGALCLLQTKWWEKGPQGDLNWSNISQILTGFDWDNCQFENSQRWKMKLSALKDVCVCVYASCGSARDVRMHKKKVLPHIFLKWGINVYFKCSGDMFCLSLVRLVR